MDSESKIAECHGEAIESLDRPLWDILLEASESHPDQEAVVSAWQTHQDVPALLMNPEECLEKDTLTTLRWTYADLRRRAEDLATKLQTRGCVPGTTLVVMLGNSAEWALFFWAAARLRMCFVPLDPRAISNMQQMAEILSLVKLDVLVVKDTTTAQKLTTIPSATEARLRIQTSPAEEPLPGWLSLSKLHLNPPHLNHNNPQSTTRPDLQEVSLIIFTSGTTSTPKGCLHTSTNLLSETTNYDPGHNLMSRWLIHTPPSHIFAILHALRAWRRGNAVIFPSESFDPRASLAALVSERCDFMAAVPALLRALLAHEDFPGREKLCLNYVTLGSTTIAEGDVVLGREALGARYVIQGFGLSEGAPVASWRVSDPLIRGRWHRGVGRVLPGARLRVCAVGKRTPIAVNEVGELHVGGSSVIGGYLGGGASDSFYDDHAGHWHVTGDQAVIDEEGVLHILGRYKDLIIRAGENVAPLQIENAIAGIDGVTVSVSSFALLHSSPW